MGARLLERGIKEMEQQIDGGILAVERLEKNGGLCISSLSLRRRKPLSDLLAGTPQGAPAAVFSMPLKSPYDKVISLFILLCLPALLVAAIIIFGNL